MINASDLVPDLLGRPVSETCGSCGAPAVALTDSGFTCESDFASSDPRREPVLATVYRGRWMATPVSAPLVDPLDPRPGDERITNRS
jgi:hypothetical protein